MISANLYDKHAPEYYEKTKVLQDIAWLRKFLSLLPKKAKVLDVGCAYGRDCKFFIKNHCETYGIDLSKEMIQSAKKLVPEATFKLMDMLDIRYDNQLFDGIWASAVLLHLKKREVPKALHELHRVLRQSGILYLYLKEGRGEEFLKDKRFDGAERFYSYFKKKEICRFLTDASFEVLEVKELRYQEAYRSELGIHILAKKR